MARGDELRAAVRRLGAGDGDRREFDRWVEPYLWLADSHPGVGEWEARKELVRHRRRQALEQLVVLSAGNLADGGRDQAIVDRLVDVIDLGRRGQVEP